MEFQEMENLFIGPQDVKDQLKEWVYNRSMAAFDAGDNERDHVLNELQLKERQARMREALLLSMGGLPSGHTSLNPQITDTNQGNGFIMEKVIFQSRPETYVTSNLYIPDGLKIPCGAVLFLCGHYDEAKHHIEYQTVCQYLVRAGLVVFAIDPVGQGERFSYWEQSSGKVEVQCGVIEHDHAGTQSWFLGDSIARYFVHDAMRAVDYLCTRPEVDPAKIGVTGNSGGGTQTSLMMICDPRIAAAAPGTFIMNRRSYLRSGQPQDAEQIWLGMTSAGYDHEDILLAMAPRPVLVLAASYDFFPIEGTRQTVLRTRRFWEMFGQSDHLEFFEEPVEHKYSINMAKRAARFFAKHLLTDPAEFERDPINKIEDDGIRPLEQSLMWCTRSGQVRGDFENARAVYEENIDRLHLMEKERRSFSAQDHKERAMTWLRHKVFGPRTRCEMNPRFIPQGEMDELDVQSVIWWSQEGMINHALMFKDCSTTSNKRSLVIAVWEDGTRCIKPHLPWIRETCSKGGSVLILDMTGVGALSPNAINGSGIKDVFGTFYKLTTDLFWLDDSLAAIRTFDVLQALNLTEILEDINTEEIFLYARGRYSLYAQLASALDPRFRRLEVVDGIESIAAWVENRYFDKHDIAGLILPGMLKYFDLPELKQWVSSTCEPTS